MAEDEIIYDRLAAPGGVTAGAQPPLTDERPERPCKRIPWPSFLRLFQLRANQIMWFVGAGALAPAGSGLKRQDNDLVVIESAETATREDRPASRQAGSASPGFHVRHDAVDARDG